MGAGERENPSDNPGGRTKRSGLKRLLLGLLAVVVLLVVAAGVVIALWGPRFAGGFVREAIASGAKASIAGPVTVDDVSLSWSGPQEIKSLKLRDPKGEVVADLTVRATTSIISVVMGSRDLGVITLGGTVNVVKDGPETSLQRAAKPVARPGGAPSAPGGGPSKLPGSLACKVVIDGLTLNYTDTTAQAGAVKTATIPGMKGEATFAVGQPVIIKLDGAGAVDDRPTSVHVDVRAENLTASDGAITPELMTLSAVIDATLPSALLAGLPGVPASARPLVDGVFAPDPNAAAKDTVLAINAKGDGKLMDATIKIEAPGASVDGALQATNIGAKPGQPVGRLKTTRPLVAQVTVTPEMAEKMQAGPDGKGATLASLAAPMRATASVELDAPVPAGAPDLRGAMVKASLETTEVRGAITLPGETDAQQVVVAPLRATFDAPDMAGPVTLQASTNATYAGQQAGDLMVDVRAAGLLDANGAPMPGAPAELSGKAELKGFATAIAQPFVQKAGLDLQRDIGPSLDVSITANALPGVAGNAASPGTQITQQVRSRNLTADSTAIIDDKGVRTTGLAAVVKINDLGPTLAGLLAKSGVQVTGTAPATLTVTALDIPFAQTKQGKSVDPSKVKLAARLETGGVRAAMRDEPQPLSVNTFAADLALNPGAPAKVVLQGQGAYGAEPFSLAGDLAFADLFDKDGKVNAAVRPAGTLKITDAPISLAGLAGQAENLPLLRQAIGPKLNVDLVAAAGEGGSSDVKADVKAANLTATANARLRTDKIEVQGVKARTTLTPGLLTAVLDQYAPTMADRPALLAPAVINADADAMTVPLVGGKPDMAKATPVKARVTIEGEGARIRGVAIGGRGKGDRRSTRCWAGSTRRPSGRWPRAGSARRRRTRTSSIWPATCPSRRWTRRPSSCPAARWTRRSSSTRWTPRRSIACSAGPACSRGRSAPARA